MSELKNKIKEAPNSPGVYQFIDKNGDILYVGKAKNIKNRIKSYFLKEIGRGPWIDLMVKKAVDIKFFETDSEIEAVILEAQLIKDIKPKHNIQFKDDKSFLVIKINKKNKKLKDRNLINPVNDYPKMFSCVELVRYKNVDFSDKKADYFGPYPAGLLLKKSLKILRKIFPFRDCSKTKYSTYRRKGRPCIYGDIRVCTAPCANWVGEQEYEKNIKYLKNFLKGRKKEIVRDLEKEMRSMSREKKYEQASLVRDKLSALNHLNDVAIGLRDDLYDANGSLFKRIECYDISNILGSYGVGSMVVFTNGKKDKDEYRKFKIKFTKKPNDLLMLKEVLTRRFKNDWPLPDLIVIDGGENQLKVAQEAIKKFELEIPAISISKGAKRDKNDFHFSNQNIAAYFMKNKNIQNIAVSARDEAHRFAINYYRQLHRKGIFK